MAKKKNLDNDTESEKIDDDLEDFDEDFDDFEDDLDLEEELDLLDTEDIDILEEEKEKIIDKDEELKQLFLSCGIHIGTKILSDSFKKRNWYYRQTNYGLWIINLLMTEQRLKVGAKFLSKFVEEGGEKVIVGSVRRYGKRPVKTFCESLNLRPALITRVVPGLLSNPEIQEYIRDAAVVVICDPHADKTLLSEARLARLPVVSLIDSDDSLFNIDLGIPANNRGKKALALAFWLLSKYIHLELGRISTEEEFPYTLDDFTSTIVPQYRNTT